MVLRRAARVVLVAALLSSACTEFDGLSVPAAASDAGGGDATGSAECPNNLEDNGDFELGTSGWSPDKAAIAWGDSGYGGQHSIQVCKEASGTPEIFRIADRPEAIMQPAQGKSYRVQAWARTELGADGGPAPEFNAYIREFAQDGSELDHGRGTISLTDDWQQVSADYTVQGADTTVSVRFQMVDAPDGWCFWVDDVCLVEP